MFSRASRPPHADGWEEGCHAQLLGLILGPNTEAARLEEACHARHLDVRTDPHKQRRAR